MNLVTMLLPAAIRSCLPLLALIALPFVSLKEISAAERTPLKAGAATSNITPELGIPIVGGFAPYPAKHVHDELFARCLVLDDGQTRIALVVCDLLGFHRQVSDLARKLIQEHTGIPASHVLISGTHTHSAGTALGEPRYQAKQELDPYQQFVARRIADGVRRSVNLLRPAEFAFGSVAVPDHVFNRRWYMKPGTMPENPFGKFDKVKMNPSPGSADLVEPAGPIDPQVSLIAVREPNGKPISVMTTYSLHYVGGVGDGHISADYFGYYCQALARQLNAQNQEPPFVGLLANGTSGDINNINFRTPRGRQAEYEQMQIVANDLAAKVAPVLSQLKYSSDIRLDARYREPLIASRRPTPDEMKWAADTLQNKPEVPGKVDLSRIYAQRTQSLADQPESLSLPVQVLAIGDCCLGTLPCEVFCEIGLEFREKSAIKPAFMTSITHGYYGYLPTPRQHDLGGYETWIGTNRLERTASEKLLTNLIEMSQEIQQARQKP